MMSNDAPMISLTAAGIAGEALARASVLALISIDLGDLRLRCP